MRNHLIFLLQVVIHVKALVEVNAVLGVVAHVNMAVPVIVKVHVEAHADMCVPGALNMVTNIVSICQI